MACRGTAAAREQRRRRRGRRGATGPPRAARSRTARPRSGCTPSSACSGGRRCSASCRPISRDGAFKHPKPDDFFAVVNEVSGQDLTWFFDQVYRSSDDVRLWRRSTRERTADGARFLRRRCGQDISTRRSAAGTGPLPNHRRGAPPRRGHVPGRRARRLREQPGDPLAVGRPRSMEAVRRGACRRAPGTRRSIRIACCCST